MAAKKNGARGTGEAGAPSGSGWVKVETRITAFWKPKKPGDYIEGVVGHRIETAGADGKTNSYYTFRLADDEACKSLETNGADGKPKVVEAEGGMLVGIGGKTLLTFLEEHEGKAVHIRYKGLGQAKKGQNAPKLYDTYERAAD